jgi:arsenite methyltransferase
MRNSLLEILADPRDGSLLRVAKGKVSSDDWLEDGELRGSSGASYRVTNGIPRFVDDRDGAATQVADSFGFKWAQRESYASPTFQKWYTSWLMSRYGFADERAMASFFGSAGCTLEVGCGSGLSAALTLSGHSARQRWVGLDISSSIDIAMDRLGREPAKEFVQADILCPPFRPGVFDLIFAEGVLHHTESTERALKGLVPLLRPGGQMLFYVYRKKAPVREFTDDYVRDLLAPLGNQEAWDALLPLTRLGQALAQLHATVDVPEDVPLLGIEAGSQDVQRLIYWNFAKLFWNEELSFEENHHVNFDWYRPRYAWRQTEEDVRRWCKEAGLSVAYLDAQESGYTVRATKG